MSNTTNKETKKTGKNSDPVNKFKATNEKLKPGTGSAPTARDKAKDMDQKRRSDAESNEL